MTKNFHGWRKSHHSDPDGHCIEVGQATTSGLIGIRDTKLDHSPILEFSPAEWRAFLKLVQANQV